MSTWVPYIELLREAPLAIKPRLLSQLPPAWTWLLRRKCEAQIKQHLRHRWAEQAKEQVSRYRDPELARHCEPLPAPQGARRTRLVCFRPKDAPAKPPAGSEPAPAGSPPGWY